MLIYRLFHVAELYCGIVRNEKIVTEDILSHKLE